MEFVSREMNYHESMRKIYCCSVSGGVDSYVEEMTEILTDISDHFVVWYGEPESVSELEKMDVLIVPVTSRLFDTVNPVMSEYLPMAEEKGIAVIPVMLEDGLQGRFDEHFGELQYISGIDNDDTALELSEKLDRTLGYHDDIMSEWNLNGRIFLSYRKKDRAFVPELLRKIHDNAIFRDFAVWYDEYLRLGENFNTNIVKELESSDLVVLMVTPGILEEGNFVRDIEYPMAKKQGKPIVAVEAVKTDRTALHKAFPNLGDVISIDDTEGLNIALFNASRALDISAFKYGAAHDRDIAGLYLEGHKVERDISRGVKIMGQAAMQGDFFAAREIATWYQTGKYVGEDPELSLRWIKEALRLAENYTPEDEDDEEYARDILMDLLGTCADFHRYCGKFEDAFDYYKRLMQIKAELGLEDRNDAYLYRDIAETLVKLGEYNAAKRFAEAGISVAKHYGDDYALGKLLKVLGETQ
ncbi:MAG: TIR domain-containing protein [Oscillospiraceae bacterium]|nr:TIR domain-containing protein [Oscillospiraceae bacterium]